MQSGTCAFSTGYLALDIQLKYHEQGHIHVNEPCTHEKLPRSSFEKKKPLPNKSGAGSGKVRIGWRFSKLMTHFISNIFFVEEKLPTSSL
jgi:hypothetical protein